MASVLAVLYWEGWVYLTLTSCAVGLLASLTFVITYQLRVGWTWWRLEDGTPNLFGRFLMERKAILALVLGLTLANALLPPWPGQLPLSFVVMTIFAVQTFVPYHLLLKVQEEPLPKETHMIHGIDPARSAGPAGDGSRALARESKYGQAVTSILSILALGAAGWLADLDLSTVPGWATGAAAVAVSTAVGTLTAWATRNRKPVPVRYR